MVVWLLVAGSVLLDVPAAENPDLHLQVRRLIRQLDARSLAERESAERELIQLGPRVLDLLSQDQARWSAEVVQRVGRIRAALERGLAEQTIRASAVTLQGEAMPLLEVLDSIQEQTGNKIDVRELGNGPPESQPKVRVDFTEMPFWKALDDVLDQANLAVNLFGPERAIFLRPSIDSRSRRGDRASYHGPFRFEPVRIEAIRDLRDPDNQLLRIALEIAWEPRLHPVSFQQPRETLEAIDENGNRLDVEARMARPELPVMPSAIATELPIPLALPARDVKRIARLKGTLVVLVPGKTEEFRFPDLHQGMTAQKRIAATTVALEGIRKNGDLWELRIGVRFDRADDALASHYNWILDSEAHLENREGQRVSNLAMNTTRRAETEIGISYLFALDSPLGDHTLVYETPGAIHSRAFQFEVRNIDLP